MHLPKNKDKKLTTVLVVALIGLLAGLFFLLVRPEGMLGVVFTVLGVLTVLFNIPALLIGLARIKTTSGKVEVLTSLLSIVIGCLMIVWHASLLMILLGVYMIVSPLLQILFARDRKAALLSELPKMIIGVVLLIIGPANALGAIFDLVGWLILILTALYVAVSLVGLLRRGKRVPNTTGSRIFVDETGDGRVDTVYFDTTGDGKVDSSAEYRDHNK